MVRPISPSIASRRPVADWTWAVMSLLYWFQSRKPGAINAAATATTSRLKIVISAFFTVAPILRLKSIVTISGGDYRLTDTMADIVNLNKFAKSRRRAEKAEKAAANRVRFGRTKAEKRKLEAEAEKRRRELDGKEKEDSGKTD